VFGLAALSPGLAQTEETDLPDMSETMAQLDQRLADLRQQINDLATAPAPVPPAPPPERSPLPLPTPGELNASAAELAEQVSPAWEPAAAGAAAEGLAQLGSQIQQLLTMRDRLLGDARELLAGYEDQLRELERQDTSEARSALTTLVEASGRAEEGAALPGNMSRPAFYDGLVTVVAAGANRIQTIQVVEDSLSRVGHVERVYIRRWHAGTLVIELTLSAGVELIGELNRVLPFPFAVQSATARQIAITLESEA
jgi:hypothetical protein